MNKPLKDSILILGALNNYGKCFSKYMYDNLYDVICLDNCSKHSFIELDPRVQLLKVDLLKDFTNEVLALEANIVAAYVFIDSIDLINAMKCLTQLKINKVIVMSSQSVYPNIENVKVTDVNFKKQEAKPYKAIEDLAKTFDYTIFRPLNTYSNTCNCNSFLDSWFEKLQEGKPVEVSTKPTTLTPISYYNKFLKDAISDKYYSNNIVNIGNTKFYSQEELLKQFNTAVESWGYTPLEYKTNTKPLLTYNRDVEIFDEGCSINFFDYVRLQSR